MTTKTLFLAAAVFCCLPFCSPPIALGLGIMFGLLGINPWPAKTHRVSSELLKLSVIGLGFGMDLRSVLRTGEISFVYTAIGIAAALALGLLLGHKLKVPRNATFLIAAGTSICGGSAIAAVRSVLDADEEETAVSLTTIFVLNSIALILFPIIGHLAGLSQRQFGLWAALAIHDTSSVVGTGLKYGPVALAVGTTIKLVRALWIVPVTLVAATMLRRGSSQVKTKWPWFILLFLFAAWVRSLFPTVQPVWDGIASVSRIGFCLTLFLIGAGLSLSGLKNLGWRPLVLGLSLWIAVASASLLLIRAGLVNI
jgi:uncharacterized integral membrane protein (TIGR00698 family)